MVLVTAIFFVLWHQVSTHEFLYSEIEYSGGSCYPWDSCIPSRSEIEDNLWGNHSCECGEHCIRYNTCCSNSPHFGKMMHVHYRGETCKKLNFFSDAVIMVSHCSKRWRNEFEVLQKCETPEDDVEDPVGIIPVTSLYTNVTYKNYFCAMCNYDYHNAYFWNISVELSTKQTILSLQNVTERFLLENMVFNPEQKSWGLNTDNDFYKLNLRFQVPGHLKQLVKKCYRNMVSNCNSFNGDLQYKCWSYYSPIQIKEEGRRVKKFRNIHCAMCNNVNLTKSDTNICKLDGHIPKKSKPSFSFALLLDINQDDGDLVGLKKLCKNDQRWDPFFKKCRSLVCAVPSYVVKNGQCVPDSEIEAKY